MNNLTNSHSPDLAVCFNQSLTHILAASFDSTGSIELREFLIDENFHSDLKTWRESLGLPTTLNTVFRFVPFFFTEQTRLAALSDEALALDDKALTSYLIDAADREILGTDGSPIIGMPLDKTAYDFVRLPSGAVTLTEIPREVLHEAKKLLVQANPLDTTIVDDLAGSTPQELQPVFLHAIETQLRAIARYEVTSNLESLKNLPSSDTVVFFSFTPDGCGFALWSSDKLFYAEIGEPFHLPVAEDELPRDEQERADFYANIYEESVYNFLHEQFYKRIEPDDPTKRIAVNRILWTASDGLGDPISHIMGEFCEQVNIPCEALELPLNEIVCRGLLLATDENADRLIPGINLANDLTNQNHAIVGERNNILAEEFRLNRRVAVACLIFPMVIAFGIIAGLILTNWRTSQTLAGRKTTAIAEKSRLEPVLAARDDYEKTLAWYGDIINQIVGLRQKQTSALSFAARLDPLYPQTTAFSITDMKLSPGGAFELKGYTRDQTAVSDFVRSMEFAADQQSNARYFTGLQVEFKQGSVQAGSPAGGGDISAALAPGVSGFSLKGVFAPASILKTQSPVVPVVQPAVNQPPPASSPAPPMPAAQNTPNNGGTK